jgi:DNA-binding NarL/FixJ family response regulator
MGTPTLMGCALVGHEHQRLTEGLRRWLLDRFDSVFMVADAASLTAGASKLQPRLVVLDLSLAAGRLAPLLSELRQLAPHSRVLVLSDHDDTRVDWLILSDGADGVVHKTALASDLSPAVDAVLAGRRFGAPEASS